jgi:hypothetical protein
LEAELIERSRGSVSLSGLGIRDRSLSFIDLHYLYEQEQQEVNLATQLIIGSSFSKYTFILGSAEKFFVLRVEAMRKKQYFSYRRIAGLAIATFSAASM